MATVLVGDNSKKRIIKCKFDQLTAFIPQLNVVYQFPAFSIEYLSTDPVVPGKIVFAPAQVFQVKFKLGSKVNVRWSSGTGNVSPMRITRRFLFFKKTYYLLWMNKLGMATSRMSEAELIREHRERSREFWEFEKRDRHD